MAPLTVVEKPGTKVPDAGRQDETLALPRGQTLPLTAKSELGCLSPKLVFLIRFTGHNREFCFVAVAESKITSYSMTDREMWSVPRIAFPPEETHTRQSGLIENVEC